MHALAPSTHPGCLIERVACHTATTDCMHPGFVCSRFLVGVGNGLLVCRFVSGESVSHEGGEGGAWQRKRQCIKSVLYRQGPFREGEMMQPFWDGTNALKVFPRLSFFALSRCFAPGLTQPACQSVTPILIYGRHADSRLARSRASLRPTLVPTSFSALLD